jgi:hypothetical protein
MSIVYSIGEIGLCTPLQFCPLLLFGKKIVVDLETFFQLSKKAFGTN